MSSWSRVAVGSGVRTKKEVEQKRKRDEEDAEKVCAQFIQEFENDQPAHKSVSTFVRGDTILVRPDGSKTIENKDSTGKSYTMDVASKLEVSANNSNNNPKKSSSSSTPLGAKKRSKNVKHKSDLELFKEQLEKEEAEKSKRRAERKCQNQKNVSSQLASRGLVQGNDNPTVDTLGNTLEVSSDFAPSIEQASTNIYVNSINPCVTEETICSQFGCFGPLASVKIMWPRTKEEHERNRNCGFVAYMYRKDAEKAIKCLNGSDLMGYDMRISWGKKTSLPLQPIYTYNEETVFRTRTNMPFNARPLDYDDKDGGKELSSTIEKRRSQEENRRKNSNGYAAIAPPSSQKEGKPNPQDTLAKYAFEVGIKNSQVLVIPPEDPNQRRLIHKLIEQVVVQGPEFEMILMQRAFNQPQFAFLYDNKSLQHTYYRWKLYSVLQGDVVHDWSKERFRMFEEGSYWIPPGYDKSTSRRYPREEVSGGKREEGRSRDSVTLPKGQLSSRKRDQLEELLRKVTMDKFVVRNVMGFCLDNLASAQEITDCISESLQILETPVTTKIGRLFVLSDVLHNSTIPGATRFRSGFEKQLGDIMRSMNQCFLAIPGRMRAEFFKKHVLSCLSAWEVWTIFPLPYLRELRDVFTAPPIAKQQQQSSSEAVNQVNMMHDGDDKNIDGEDIDGEGIASSFVTHPTTVSEQDTKSKWTAVEKVDERSVPKPSSKKSKWCSIDEDGAVDTPSPPPPTKASKWSTIPVELETPAILGNRYILGNSSISRGTEDEDMANLDGEDIDVKQDKESSGFKPSAAPNSRWGDNEEDTEDQSQNQNSVVQSNSLGSIFKQTKDAKESLIDKSQLTRETLREIEVKVLSYSDSSVTAEQTDAYRRSLIQKVIHSNSTNIPNKNLNLNPNPNPSPIATAAATVSQSSTRNSNPDSTSTPTKDTGRENSRACSLRNSSSNGSSGGGNPSYTKSSVDSHDKRSSSSSKGRTSSSSNHITSSRSRNRDRERDRNRSRSRSRGPSRHHSGSTISSDSHRRTDSRRDKRR